MHANGSGGSAPEGEAPSEDSLLAALGRWDVACERSPRTRTAYRYALLRLARAGFRRIEDVTAPKLAAYLTERARSRSRATANADLAALCSVLSVEVAQGRCKRKLVRSLRRLRFHRKAPKRLAAKHLSQRQVERLAGAAGPLARLAIWVAAYSGLRTSELCRLHWSNVHLGDEPYLDVLEDLSLGQVGRLKTGERRVPVCRQLKALLEACPARVGFLFRRRHRDARQGFVDAKTLRRWLKRASRASGVRPATYMLLRHSRASWWAQAGVSLTKIASWLGHSTLVCERFYLGLRSGYDGDCERTPA